MLLIFIWNNLQIIAVSVILKGFCVNGILHDSIPAVWAEAFTQLLSVWFVSDVESMSLFIFMSKH